MPNINSRARLAGQLRRTLDAVIPLVEGEGGRAAVAKAELAIASLRDVVAAMKKQAPRTMAPRRSCPSRYGDDRLSR